MNLIKKLMSMTFMNKDFNPGKLQYLISAILLVLLIQTKSIAQEETEIQIKEVWIPMSDGIKLAADLYMPAKSKKNKPYPVILEYLPYRKDEGRRNRYSLFSYFIQQGYIVARVDIRGTGRSEGTVVDGEYSEQEQQDGEQVIDWLSRQKFSTGKIAMMGISWGGFNALHMAMRRPPALKTIITLMSTDDIYQDDVHFMDGMMHIDAYELGQDLTNALPGSPDFVIDEEYFKNRFDTYPWLLKYKKQQTDGPFWDRASLNEDYSRIDVPIFAIGGLYDGYRDFIPRILNNADVPVKAILGPWNHTWPNWAEPEPAIEWRDMAVRWLDYWLKGSNNGILDEPAVYYYQRDWHAPGGDLTNIPGSWKEADTWPETSEKLFYLNEHHQLDSSASTFNHSLNYKPSVGVEASGSVMWWGDWAPDQKGADIYSLVYDSPPVSEPLEIIGFPEIILQTSTTAPSANWIVRLSDVAPNGMVTQITGAGFNANHIKSAINPVELVPDSIYQLTIELHATSWTFEKGHRIRIAINNSQWPMIWPTRYPMTATIHSMEGKSSYLKLPVFNSSEIKSRPFSKPFVDPDLDGYKTLTYETLSGYAEIKEIIRNERTHTTTVLATNSGSDKYPWGIMHYTEEIIHEVTDDNPAEASVKSTYTMTLEKYNQMMKWSGILVFTSDLKNYYYDYTRKLEIGDKLIREKNWNEIIPRR